MMKKGRILFLLIFVLFLTSVVSVYAAGTVKRKQEVRPEDSEERETFAVAVEEKKKTDSKEKLGEVPVYLEEELLFGKDGYFFLNRDACFTEGSNARWNYTGALLDAYPTEAIRSRDSDTVYFVYETDTGYRLYLFFSYENDLDTPVGFPVVVGKALSYRDFKDVAVGDWMEEVEAIDPTASLHKKMILEVFDLVPIAAQRLAEQGYPCTTIHYLKDGILKIEYEMQEDRSLVVSNMVFSKDYQIESANGKVVNYKIEDIDLPTN